jgi:hypothetical protein
VAFVARPHQQNWTSGYFPVSILLILVEFPQLKSSPFSRRLDAIVRTKPLLVFLRVVGGFVGVVMAIIHHQEQGPKQVA